MARIISQILVTAMEDFKVLEYNQSSMAAVVLFGLYYPITSLRQR